MAKKKPSGRRDSDKNTSTEVEEPIGWAAYLFGGYNADQDKVSLHRISPKEHLGVPTFGWLDDLGPGVDENYIRENYGGGKFLLNKRDRGTGKITASCTLDIPGYPRVSSTVTPSETGDDQGVAEPIMLEMGGAQFPFKGDLQQFAQMAFMMKSIKSMFPDPPDINTTLLELALKPQPATDPLDTIRTLKEAAGLFGGSSDTGATVYDLLQTALQQAGPVISAMMTPGVRRLARTRPALAGSGPGHAPGNQIGLAPAADQEPPGGGVAITPPPEQSDESQPPTNEGKDMSQRDLVFATASTIVSCWKLNPHKDVSSTVRMIDLILQQGEASVRQVLVDQFKETILDITETQLSEDWVVDDGTVGNREQFGRFFAEVFTEYARSDREVLDL